MPAKLCIRQGCDFGNALLRLAFLGKLEYSDKRLTISCLSQRFHATITYRDAMALTTSVFVTMPASLFFLPTTGRPLIRFRSMTYAASARSSFALVTMGSLVMMSDAMNADFIPEGIYHCCLFLATNLGRVVQYPRGSRDPVPRAHCARKSFPCAS